MVLGRKTNFFLAKKHHLLGDYAAKVQSDGLLVFPRKKLGFSAQSHLFPRKKFFFLGKTKKKHFFGVWPHSVSKKCFLCFFWFSLGKSWFSFPKPSFS